MRVPAGSMFRHGAGSARNARRWHNAPVAATHQRNAFRLALRAARREWRQVGPTVRVSALTMWALGVALLAVGVWFDHTHRWDDFPFLTNMVSALDGALFGLPVALVVVTRLAVREANRNEEAEIFRRLGNVSRRLSDQARDVEMILPLTERHEVEQAIAKLDAALATLRQQLSRMLNNADKQNYFKLAHEIDTGIVDLVYVWGPIEEAMSREIADIAAEWRVCGDYLRPRLAALGIPWISATLDSEINSHMDVLIEMKKVGAYRFDLGLLPHTEVPPNGRPAARPFVATARVAMSQPLRQGTSTLEALQLRLLHLQRLLTTSAQAVTSITTACRNMDTIIEIHRDRPRPHDGAE